VVTQQTLIYAAGVLLGTLAGPVGYAVWVRNQERYAPEPWASVAKAFGWGASGAVVLAIAVSLLLAIEGTLTPIGVSSALVGAIVVAPIVEEATKGLGLRWIDDHHVELEDGLVYGAAAGLGFSATENLVYGVSAYLEGGIEPLVWTIGLRTFTSSLLHASASALVGYALWRTRARDEGAARVASFYLGAVLLHSAFNAVASIPDWITFFVGLAIAVAGFSWVRRRVRELDQPV
jgi:RsiW-degrading membrane proteinase PrsW (M82 family)